MLVSLNWLKEFVDIPKNLDPQALADKLTLKTAEVENVTMGGKGLEGVVVGELLEFKKHPNADKLHVAKVNVGKEKPLRLIFGQMVGMNIGDKIPVAIAPTKLPSEIEIEKKEVRGIMSEGMLCLDQELGFKDEGVSIQYFPNEKPGTPLAKALHLDDTVLEFDNKSLNHRPDLWGHYGIAREISAITNSPFKPLNPKPPIPTKGESPKIEVKDFNLCPRFTGLIINNITVEESPKWLKDRLKATGHGAHNNIVDVTNFVMAEIGQPMHAFDKNLINKGLIIRPAKPNETLTSLDNKPRKLDPSMCIVADHKNPLAIAGIIGGASSEINPKTTSIILEAANWNAPGLRRTSQKLGVRTDAVQRFEKYLDPTLTELAIKRAAELILKLCPKAQIAGPITDVKDPKKKNLISPYPTKIDLNLLKTKSKIGVDIKEPEIKKILTSLHFKPIKKSKDTLAVQIPSFRATKDVSQEDDLIEEIARIYGFENIPPSLPLLPTNLPKENSERFKKHRARELFSYGLGFNEVSNYSFYGEADFKKCLMTEEGHLKLQNFLSEDQTRLRTSLIPHLLRNLQLNIKYTDCISIYEIGRTYKDLGEYFPLEEKFIGGAILKKEKPNDPFYKAKGAVESFFEKFNFTKIKEVKGVKSAPYAHPTKSQSYIDQNGQTIAKVFCLHPEVQKTHELDAYSIALFEINFTEALKLPQKEKKFKELPRFPGISLDISVLVDRTREVNDIKNAITSANKELIKDTSLFDIYEGDKIEKGKKAVAFTVFLQSNDRTLTEEDMTQTQNKIFQNLTKIGGKVRGA